MTARTQVGIVEWARRIERARLTEMWLAETLGDRVDRGGRTRPRRSTSSGGRVATRGMPSCGKASSRFSTTRRSTPSPTSGIGAGASPESVLERLDAGYGAWRAEASLVAEAPIIRVLELVLRDHEDRAGR